MYINCSAVEMNPRGTPQQLCSIFLAYMIRLSDLQLAGRVHLETMAYRKNFEKHIIKKSKTFCNDRIILQVCAVKCTLKSLYKQRGSFSFHLTMVNVLFFYSVAIIRASMSTAVLSFLIDTSLIRDAESDATYNQLSDTLTTVFIEPLKLV